MSQADIRGVIVGSANARVGFPAAIEILRAGGSAIDAAVAAVRGVEDDLQDQGRNPHDRARPVLVVPTRPAVPAARRAGALPHAPLPRT